MVPCHVLYCDKQDRHNLFFPEFAASSSLKNWVWKGVDIGCFFLVYSRERGIRREGSRRDFQRSLNFH